MDQPRRVSRAPVAELLAAKRPDVERTHLQPHRRAACRAHDLAAGDDRRRAQLGLSLHVDSRWHLHALGSLHAGLRPRGERLLLLHRRRGERQEGLADHVGIGGEPELTEKTLDHLSGYDGSRPVRIGNAAYQQVQHDVWGAVLDSVYLHTKSRDYLPVVVWPILKRAVESAI